MGKIFTTCMLLRELSRELPSEPPSHGMTWTSAMKTDLARDFCKLYNLRALCLRHGRTPDSIIAKLRDLSLLTFNIEDSSYYYNIPVKQQPDNQPETQLENDMTQPLQNLTLIFGSDIKTMTEPQLITNITRCTAEINSFSVIPRNKWTEKRAAELQAAIDAAVAELNTRA
jgi:hypothetical protein